MLLSALAMPCAPTTRFPHTRRQVEEGAGGEGTPTHYNAFNHLCAHALCPSLYRASRRLLRGLRPLAMTAGVVSLRAA